MEDDLKWNDYVLDDYHFTEFPPGSLVVDVGCGYGDLLERLTKQGCRAIGVEVDEEAIAQCHSRGLRVLKAPAEALPIATASMDGGICKGVLPYTDEAQAFAELRRVVKTGEELKPCTSGLAITRATYCLDQASAGAFTVHARSSTLLSTISPADHYPDG